MQLRQFIPFMHPVHKMSYMAQDHIQRHVHTFYAKIMHRSMHMGSPRCVHGDSFEIPKSHLHMNKKDIGLSYRCFKKYAHFSFWKPFHKENGFGVYNVTKPGEISAGQPIPGNIICPSYSTSMKPLPAPAEPDIKDGKQISLLRKACKLARHILDTVSQSLHAGMTTDAIDQMVHCLCIDNGAYPSPLNYLGFPKSVCTSVNNVACHGIPDDRPLMDGDIINIDVSVYLNGYHGDCSATYMIGNVDAKGKELVEATKMCLSEAISVCKNGELISQIGHVIETVARRQGFTVLPQFGGHGIGSYFHGPPNICHTYNEYPGRMKTGMAFTIEPVLSQGDKEIVILEDGWTAVTLDNARTAQFEHTLLITDHGAEILTGPAW